MNKVWITAHSGCEGLPDNSMESLLKAIELGSDCVEVDVRMDDAGVLRMSHDLLEDYSDTVLLETALRLIAERGVAVNFDLKEERTLYPVLEMAEDCGIPREKLFFSGAVDLHLLDADSSIARRARILINTEEVYRYVHDGDYGTREAHLAYMEQNMDAVAELMCRMQLEGLNAPFRYLDHERIAALRAAGIGLSLWTVNEAEDQRRLLAEDILNITTRNPGSALEIRREVRG